MNKTALRTGMTVLLAGVILLPFPSHGKDVMCEMPYKKLMCQLQNNANLSIVNCFRNGQTFASFQCESDGSDWRCVSKEGPGGPVRQLSHTDFQNDVARCDRLCEFCVYDWKPVPDKPRTDQPAADRDGKKCKIVSKCIEEGEVEVTKFRKNCSQSSFSDQRTCKDEPYQAKQKACLLYKDSEVCE